MIRSSSQQSSFLFACCFDNCKSCHCCSLPKTEKKLLWKLKKKQDGVHHRAEISPQKRLSLIFYNNGAL